jgi:hypothetical protein
MHTPNTSRRKQQARSIEPDRPAQVLGRRLLEVLVYEICCRPGDRIGTGQVAESEIGDWKMPQFKAGCSYAVSQGWLIADEDCLILTNAGMAAA